MILFQHQIEEHQKLADHYRELAAKREALAAGLVAVQQKADTNLSSLKDLVDKCREVSPDAIASLKSAVLNLFVGGDDDGGNQPIDPTPDIDPNEPEIIALNGITGDCLLSSDLDDTEGFDPPRDCPVSSDEHVIASGTAPTGQTCTIDFNLYWDNAAPDGSAWDFASSLACLTWEDAPYLGQCCTIEVFQAQPEKTIYTDFVEVSDRLGYIRVNTTGEIIATYAGFNNKARAKAWANYLETMTSRIELRSAKRLGDWKHELKLWGLSIKQIERLATEDLDKMPPASEPSLPPTYKPQPIPQPVNPEEVGEGDIVTALLTPSASYKIIRVMPNGILDCENLTTGDRLGLRPGAVSLVQKASVDTPYLTTSGNYTGLAKQTRQRWERAGIDPQDLIADMKAKRPPEPEWNAAKYNPVLAAVGADDASDF